MIETVNVAFAESERYLVVIFAIETVVASDTPIERYRVSVRDNATVEARFADRERYVCRTILTVKVAFADTS